MKTIPADQSAREIIKQLERVTASGHRADQIFEDWLDLVEASLEALPGHIKNAGQGQILEDTPETQALWKQIKARYDKDWYWENFVKAFAILVESTVKWKDTIGAVYMSFANPNPGAGQYFTPWNIAKAMATMTMGDVLPEIHNRMKEAIGKDILTQSIVMAGLVIQDAAEAEQWFYNRVIPAAAPHFDVLTVCDPCVGSGVMLLAAASEIPRWALDWGLIQFYGMDIDPTCVKMARVNCMLYGLNGYHLKCVIEASQQDFATLPEPYPEIYTQAQEAQAIGDFETVQEITLQLRKGQFSFLDQMQS